MKGLWPILFGFLSVLLGNISQNEITFHIFGITDPQAIKDRMWYCLIISSIYPGIVLPIQFWLNQKRKQKLEDRVSDFLSDFKEIFVSQLKTDLETSAIFNVRIFFPVGGVKGFFNSLLGAKHFRSKRNIILANDSLPELGFRVYPNPEGVIGEVFTKNKSKDKFNVIHDDDVQKNSAKYGLSKYLAQKTNRTKFVVAYPIFDKKDQISAIVSIDSEQKITVPDMDELKITIIESSLIIDKFLPSI